MERRRRWYIALDVRRQREVYLPTGRGGTTWLDPRARDSSWSGPLVLDCETDAEIQTSEFQDQVANRDRGHIKQQASRAQRDIRPTMCFNLVGKLPLRRLQDSCCVLLQARRVRTSSVRCRSTAAKHGVRLGRKRGNPTRDWSVVFRTRQRVGGGHPLHDKLRAKLESNEQVCKRPIA